MKFSISKAYLGLLFMILLQACQQPDARKPISQSKNALLKQSIERSKTQINDEEESIKNYIEKDSTHTYLSSSQGFWYTYVDRHLEDSKHPKTGDLVRFTYSVSDLNQNTLYSESEIGTLQYRVDQENMMKGLRHAIKLLKQNEKAIFLFPSHLAYSFAGDLNKIDQNMPIVVTLTLQSIENQ